MDVNKSKITDVFMGLGNMLFLFSNGHMFGGKSNGNDC